MRSVVVVLPASTWAMMPILRISERGGVRAISRFHHRVERGAEFATAGLPCRKNVNVIAAFAFDGPACRNHVKVLMTRPARRGTAENTEFPPGQPIDGGRR